MVPGLILWLARLCSNNSAKLSVIIKTRRSAAQKKVSNQRLENG
jgi:hypothetical protein